MSQQDFKSSQSRLRAIEILLALFAASFYVLCIGSAMAQAGDKRVAESSKLAPLKPEAHNGAYLEAISAEVPRQSTELRDQIWDKPITDELTQRFNAFNRDFEARQAFQLNTREDHIRYQESTRGLVEWAMRKLLQYHFENTLKRRVEQTAQQVARESGKGSGGPSAVARTAATAANAISSVHRAITNSTFKFGEETRTRFKYDFPSGMMRVGVTSPIVDAAVDYRIRPVDRMVGSIAQPEKLGVGLSKSLSSLGASTSARYGLASKTINCGMNKHLVGPLSAQVDQVHNMQDTSQDETVGRLNLGLSF